MHPRCRHSPACGGCDFQDRTYEEQLAYKRTFCRNCFASFGVKDYRELTAAAQVWFYRTRMDFCVAPSRFGPGGEGGGPDRIAIGMRRQQSSSNVIDLEECPVFIEGLGELLSWLRQWISSRQLAAYDQRAKSGIVRYVSLRHAASSDSLMLCLVLNMGPDEFAGCRELFNEFGTQALGCARMRSVYVSFNRAVSDTGVTPEAIHLAGEEYLIEQVNGIEYLIGPATFFQSSAEGCSRLYQVIRGFIPQDSGRILDLYCGSGGIALELARHGHEVVGVDNLQANIEQARRNAVRNRIENAHFVCRDAGDFLAHEAGGVSVTVVDPPRAGLTRQALSAIMAHRPGQLVYVSCNPLQLRQDLAALSGAYTVETLEGVDMFPQTRHLEVVAVLQRKNSF